ncbi:MAG: hypothetical protein H7177_10910 [Rhizobacter sp.]|nr:hypothetical protein [Bacteriovorax sp.]
MSLEKELAARLRQSVQGCTIHLHGPVQAWVALNEASQNNGINIASVKKIASEASAERINALVLSGVSLNDPRIIKEEITKAFIEKLLE